MKPTLSFLKNIDISLGNLHIRIVFISLIIAFLLITVGASLDVLILNQQITAIDTKFINKDQELMLNILNSCQGDLGSQEVVQTCLSDKYEELVTTLKDKRKAIFIGLSIKLFFMVIPLGGYYLIRKIQK